MESKNGKKKSKTKVVKSAAPAVNVCIDYPVEGEKVLPGHYAVRVGAPAEHKVEVSFDGKKWHECRQSAGYYWNDWQPAGAGKTKIQARCWVGPRRTRRSEARSCWIAKANTN